MMRTKMTFEPDRSYKRTTNFAPCLSFLIFAKGWITDYFSDQKKRSSIFDMVMPDILLCIGDHLDSADVASLALCSRSLWHTLGYRCRQGVRLNLDDKQDLLMRLVRDNSDYYYCFKCSHLHLSKDVGPPMWYFPHCEDLNIDDMLDDCFSTHAEWVRYDLSFVHVQLVMERHRSTRNYGLSVDELTVMEVHERSLLNDVMTVLSIEPQILGEELCLRVQQWHIFPPGETHRALDPIRPMICSHVTSVDRCRVSFFKCKLQHGDSRPDCTTCHPYLTCKLCGIDFHMQQKELGSDGSAIVLTKWMNLGRGITPLDDHWRSKILGSSYPQGSPIERVSESDGLYSRFECSFAKKAEDLTMEVASLLRGGRFRETFRYDFGHDMPRLQNVWTCDASSRRIARKATSWWQARGQDHLNERPLPLADVTVSFVC